MSAKNRLISVIGVLLAFVIVLIVSIAYNSFKSSSVNNYTEKLHQQTAMVAAGVEQKVLRHFDMLAASGNAIKIESNGQLNETELFSTLKFMESEFDIVAAFFGLADGITYRSSSVIQNFNAKQKKREWYTRAMADEKHIITTPYKATSGKLVMSLVIPVKRSGKIVAILGANILLDSVSNFVDTLADKSKLFVARKDGYTLAAPISDLVGKNLYEDVSPSYSQYRSQSGSSHNYQFEEEGFFAVNAISPLLGWSVWSFDKESNIYAASHDNLINSVSIAIVLILITLAMIYFLVIKLMYIPIGGEPKEIEAIVKKVADGDLSLAGTAKGDETGVYGAILGMVTNLKSIIEDINKAAEHLNLTSVQMTDSASEVQLKSESQTMQLEQTSTAMNEMSATVDEVACNALQASSAAAEASDHSTQGLGTVEELNHSISDLLKGLEQVVTVNNHLEKETQEIGGILEVIDGISEQTNLLALNAAIEAARAGEHGRGFAVVADEVRNLANRTKESTNEIQEMIIRLQNESKHSVELMQVNMKDAQATVEKSDSANQALQSIQGSVSVIQDMNNQIATAAEEQTHVAAEINASVVEISDLAKVTFDAAAANSNRANDLTGIALSLNQSVEIFKL